MGWAYTGRPISGELRVDEKWHRVSIDRLELSVTIDDPKMYTRPWVSMDWFPMKLMDPHADLTEMYCSAKELEIYNKKLGNRGESSNEPVGLPDSSHLPCFS